MGYEFDTSNSFEVDLDELGMFTWPMMELMMRFLSMIFGERGNLLI